MKTLTERQQEILDFIRQRQESEGMAPTLREVATHFRFSSVNAALAHVQALLAKGVLKRVPRRARSLQVVDAGPSARRRPRVVSVPIYGSIPAGRPEDAAQEAEGCVLMDVETLGIRPTARTFGLQVRGDSMIGKHITDGDIAIIEHGVQPRSGDVVAALIDGQVTLKTFVLQRGKPYLRAENPRYPDLIPQEELQIQGVMVALVRKRK
ncbi:MAG TPA: transcriptional repressor LexA [Verrucomicrobiota bacterium]|jgi:repressor LexA|nr:transcriptional repressor LexA [Verrucomicrobiota bacterium]HRT07782.1 transcriptional repressor LexA [Candidatus Paceibacterota bacterium]HRT58733.1 transcriptional repressor LexA [Candidatus Paceibacterota bacterium]